jgi:hypothetical protein
MRLKKPSLSQKSAMQRKGSSVTGVGVGVLFGLGVEVDVGFEVGVGAGVAALLLGLTKRLWQRETKV